MEPIKSIHHAIARLIDDEVPEARAIEIAHDIMGEKIANDTVEAQIKAIIHASTILRNEVAYFNAKADEARAGISALSPILWRMGLSYEQSVAVLERGEIPAVEESPVPDSGPRAI